MPIYHLSQDNDGDTGLIRHQEALTLDIEDDQLIRSFNKRIKDSQNYWDSDKDLENRRKLMKEYWMGKHRTMPLYDYQYPAYIDNRFYMHAEHIVQTVNAQSAEPVTNSRDRSAEAKRAAHEFGEYLHAYAENHRWNDIDRISTRHLLMYFLGVQKIEWDPKAGPQGEDGKPIGNVIIKYVNPKNIVVDRNAKPAQDPTVANPSFVAEIVHDTLETMIEKFPDKKDALLQALGMRGVTSQMSAVIGYWEVHFSYFVKGIPKEGRVWFTPEFNLVLDKQKTPDWDDKGEEVDGETVYKNMLDRPLKPYAFLNMTTMGEDFVDETGPLEQFIPLQDQLNKRGQHISDMGDEQKGGKVFNTRMVNKSDAARFTNDPGAQLLVKGNPNEAYARVTPDMLPNYVIEDKYDARSEGDNVVGVHGPTRGERQGSDQPTTIQLLKEGDFQRRGDLINGIERMNEYKYRYAAHLMKLHYTEEHMESVTGNDGKKTFLTMTSNEIPPMAITVKAGTTLPTDKITQREEAMELMRLGKIDYITFFERLGFPNPKEQAFKLYQHETDPETAYASPAEAEQVEEDIERLKEGKTPELPDEVTEGYLMGLTAFLKSEDFANLTPDNQTQAAEYIRSVIEKSKQAPSPMEATEEGGQVQSPGPGGKTGPLSAMRGGLNKAANGVRSLFGG